MVDREKGLAMAEALPGEQPSETVIKGYLTRFCLEKRVSEYGKIHFDLEVAFTKEYEGSQPESIIRFLGVQDLHFGNPTDGISLGSWVQLEVWDIASRGWEDLSYLIMDTEEGLSLYCRAFELERKV